MGMRVIVLTALLLAWAGAQAEDSPYEVDGATLEAIRAAAARMADIAANVRQVADEQLPQESAEPEAASSARDD